MAPRLQFQTVLNSRHVISFLDPPTSISGIYISLTAAYISIHSRELKGQATLTLKEKNKLPAKESIENGASHPLSHSMRPDISKHAPSHHPHGDLPGVTFNGAGGSCQTFGSQPPVDQRLNGRRAFKQTLLLVKPLLLADKQPCHLPIHLLLNALRIKCVPRYFTSDWIDVRHSDTTKDEGPRPFQRTLPLYLTYNPFVRKLPVT